MTQLENEKIGGPYNIYYLLDKKKTMEHKKTISKKDWLRDIFFVLIAYHICLSPWACGRSRKDLHQQERKSHPQILQPKLFSLLFYNTLVTTSFMWVFECNTKGQHISWESCLW